MTFADFDLNQQITDILGFAEERLVQGAADDQRSITTMSGYSLEGVNLLGKAEGLILRLTDARDQLTQQKRLDDIWVAYVRATNLSGLGAAAGCLRTGRNG